MNQWVTSLPAIGWQGRRISKTFVCVLLPAVIVQSLALYSVYRALRRGRAEALDGKKGSNDIEPTQKTNPNKDRIQGDWTPQAFEYPEVTPCPHPIKDVKPVPYRPFRWGEYHITMGIRTMPWTEWMELDESFLSHQRIRTLRMNQCGETVLRILPARDDLSVKVAGGTEAVKELLYELAEYLPRRYPSSFRVSRLPESASVPTVGGIPLSWKGEIPVKTIEVVETGAKYNLDVLESMDGVEMGEAAFKIINGLMQDDVAVMIEGSDGKYYFQAGLICVPGAWRMRDKIGMPLDKIHIAEVPQFKEKLEVGMNRFFQRLPLDKPVIRNNYGIQIVPPVVPEKELGTEETLSDVDPEELSWSESINGPEDDYVPGSRHLNEVDVPWVSPSTLRLRSERQTLRRLPRTGAIIFGIRTYRFKVEELAQERGVAARLASAVRSWPEDIAAYKGRTRYRDVLLAYLDECAKKDGITGPVEGMPLYPY